MKIDYRQGDVLRSGIKTVVHQVNCQGVMGSGIAKHIKASYPTVFNHYRKTCEEFEPEELLGHAQVCVVDDTRIVINLFGQLNYGAGTLQTSYEALRSGFKVINLMFASGVEPFTEEYVIGMPMIGCGLGGGDWKIVEQIIEQELTCVQPVVFVL